MRKKCTDNLQVQLYVSDLDTCHVIKIMTKELSQHPIQWVDDPVFRFLQKIPLQLNIHLNLGEERLKCMTNVCPLKDIIGSKPDLYRGISIALQGREICEAWLVGWFLKVLVNNLAISHMGPKTESLTILHAATHETELGDHEFCLSRSHYTDTDPTSRERAATVGTEPGTSSPGVSRSTD